MAISGGDGSIILDTKVDTKGLNSGLNSMKGAITKIGGLLAAAFSVKMLINFAKESKNLYKIQMENEVKLATIMRQRMAATDEQIQQVLELTAAEQKLGIVGDDVQIAGLQQLATFATQKSTIETLLPAMNNLIAQQYGYEASAESARNAANLMGKVLQGQTGALTRVGITFSEAEEQALKMGNEMQRAAVLAQVITNNVGEMNYALAQTDVGRQKQLANTFGDIKEQFGAAFQQIAIIALPALNAVAKALAWVANVARMVAQTIANMFGMKTSGGGGNQSTGLGGISTSSDKAAKGMSNLGNATEKAGKQAKKSTAAFDDLQILTESAASSAGKAAEGIGELGDVGSSIGGDVGTGFDFGIQADVDTAPLENALKRIGEIAKTVWDSEPIQTFVTAAKTTLKTFEEFATVMWRDIKTNASNTWLNIETDAKRSVTNLTALWTLFWKDFNNAVTKWGSPIIQSISNLFNSIWETAIDPAVQFITRAWADFTGILLKLWNEHGAILLNNIGEFVNTTIGLFQKIYDNIIQPIITPFLEMLSWLWDKHLSKLVEKTGEFVFTLIEDALEIYNKFIAPIVGFLSDLLAPAWAATMGTLQGLIGTLIGTVSDVATGIIEILTGLLDYITGVFTGNWKKSLDGLKTTFRGVMDIIKGIFKGVINYFIDVINGLISGVNKFSEKINTIPGVNIPQINKIPKLATGAVLPPNKPFLAMVGDQKSGTNIEAPLATIVEAMNIALQGQRQTYGNTEVVLEIDGREFGRAVVEQGNRESRRIGTRLVLV